MLRIKLRWVHFVTLANCPLDVHQNAIWSLFNIWVRFRNRIEEKDNNYESKTGQDKTRTGAGTKHNGDKAELDWKYNLENNRYSIRYVEITRLISGLTTLSNALNLYRFIKYAKFSSLPGLHMESIQLLDLDHERIR